MQIFPDAHIQELAESCVNEMGDIFWDFQESRDAPVGFVEPWQTAVGSVANTLHFFANTLETNSVYTVSLRLEYRELLARLGANANDSEIVAALVSEAAWTNKGARTVLWLAQTYGTSILRNALALAEALDIEDGQAGL